MIVKREWKVLAKAPTSLLRTINSLSISREGGKAKIHSSPNEERDIEKSIQQQHYR
jgi:hypothetical protein